MMLSPFQQRLLNDYQQDFPLTPRPFRTIAESLGVSEDEVLAALRELSDERLINRIGPVIKPNRIGNSMLVAMAVPSAQLEQVAELISRFPEVNHNYERENRFNLWFVLIADSIPHLQRTLAAIERQTGIKALRLPLLTDYFINLGFALELDDGCDGLPAD